MKFVNFSMSDVAKVPEVSTASDKVWANPPPGVKVLAAYSCQGLAFPGVLPNTIVGIRIVEAESSEALAATLWPIAVAGSTVWSVPVLDLPVGGTAELEKRLRG